MAGRPPRPGSRPAQVLVPAPGAGPGFWAGASSATFDVRGDLVIAYRVRTPDVRGARVEVAVRAGGGELSIVATVRKESFGAESLERPALVRVGDRWRLYVSCATPNTKHWRIDVLESDDPGGLANAEPRTVFPGSHDVGVKDPVIRLGPEGWRAWVCCHPLEEPGEEDRMATALATSEDGLAWQWRGTVLSGRSGAWDERGARVTAVLPDGLAAYDGRATRAENFSEMTGWAEPGPDGALRALPAEPVAGVRYLDVVRRPGGGHHLFYERTRADGGHELVEEIA